MVTTITYEPIVGEEILFQPSNMKVEYIKELNTAQDILEHETPLYKDVIESIMDFTVGNTSYWKEKFTNGVIKELNNITYNGECDHFLYESWSVIVKRGYYKRSINFYTSKFEKIMKEKNIKTKKQIVEYYAEHRLTLKFNNDYDRFAQSNEKALMRMKKDNLIKQYAFIMYDINNTCSTISSAHNNYLNNLNTTERYNVMKDFMKRNLYEYYLLL